jgi:hypothetical protein
MKKKIFCAAVFSSMYVGSMYAPEDPEDRAPVKNLAFYQKMAQERLPLGQQTPSTTCVDVTSATLCDVKYNALQKALLAGVKFGILALPWWNRHIRTSTREWFDQVNLLTDNDIDPASSLQLGPLKDRKTYLVSKKFWDTRNTRNTDVKPRYELYFMPHDAQLVTLFKKIVDILLFNRKLKKKIAFIALRLTPSITYSNGKPLPRIIVGMWPEVEKEDANEILQALYNATREFEGFGIHPRYSSAVTTGRTNLIYAAFDNGDYKETHQDKFERKKGFLWSNAPDDMAYQNASQALSLPYTVNP